jgi:23S rRNA (adenine2503-C2)-methyltransferase
MVKETLCGLTADEIFHFIEPYGFASAYAVKIAHGIYKKHINDISLILGSPKKSINNLSNIARIGLNIPIDSQISADGSVKYLFRTESGKEFETVYIPENKRNTVCVSTQSGCRMGCPLCVTSRYGFRGNLTAGEIVNQIISIPAAGSITHVVFMGMGEPMDNLDNVLKACKIITAEWGLAISHRNVTISTVGITTGITEFLEKSCCNLTLSLHSPFPGERCDFVPVEKKYPVQNIIEIMRNYPLKKKRRLSVAYIMIKDLNDTDKHLEGLKDLLKGSVIRVNLLQYHPSLNDINTTSSKERMHYFKHNLIISGISASVRKSRGIDISAACGLLATGLK